MQNPAISTWQPRAGFGNMEQFLRKTGSLDLVNHEAG
jgi:hypothetical protein